MSIKRLITKPKLFKTAVIVCVVIFLLNTILFSHRTLILDIITARTIVERLPARHTMSLLLFTTWPDIALFKTGKVKFGKKFVHQTVVNNWLTLSPLVQPLLFTREDEVLQQVPSPYWSVLAEKEVDCGNIPTLRGMMNQSMTRIDATLYGFANSDLVFATNFWETIKVIRDDEALMKTPLLVVAKRINLRFNDSVSYDANNIRNLAQAGSYPEEGSSDIFITNKLFPWNGVSKLVVGRMGIGMWLLTYARAKSVNIIDITQTATIVHLTTSMGIHESGYALNYDFNLKVMEKEGFPTVNLGGSLDCAERTTAYFGESKIMLIKKKKLPASCFSKTIDKFVSLIQSRNH